MKILIWIVGIPCMAAELFSKWLCFPLSNQLRGFQFPLLGYSPAHHGFSTLSYGAAAAVLCALASCGFWLGRNRLLCWSGAGLIWLSAMSILQVACTDPRLLNELASELDQQQSAKAFSGAALPVNSGSEPSVWPRVPLDSVGERLIAGWYFCRFGSWLALLLGITALGYGASGERQFAMVGVTLAGMALLLVASGSRPILAEFAATRARLAEARGDPDTAVALYRQALRLDGWAALNSDLYERIGAIDANFGRTGTVAYGIYHAELALTQIDITKAIAELNGLIPRTAEPLSTLLRQRVAQLLAQHGRALHAYGAYGAAAAECENALRIDPHALLPAYYLSREYFLLGAYRDAIAIGGKLVARVDDPTFRANTYSNVGDSYSKLGAFAEAKLAYRQSYFYDYLLNLHGLSALSGP